MRELDWCKHCVYGRARNDPHFKAKDDEDGKPKLSWDYMYMHEEGSERSRPDVIKGEGLPIIITQHDRLQRCLCYSIPQKGGL